MTFQLCTGATSPLSFIGYFSEFVGSITVREKCRLLTGMACESGPESEPAKLDRLLIRLGLRLKQPETAMVSSLVSYSAARR